MLEDFTDGELEGATPEKVGVQQEIPGSSPEVLRSRHLLDSGGGAQAAWFGLLQPLLWKNTCEAISVSFGLG